MVGVYFALIKNMLTGMYDSRVKGYIRTCGGYRPGARMKDLTEECAQIASLVLDLEKMEISVTKEEAEAFCQNLAEIENREGSSGEEDILADGCKRLGIDSNGAACGFRDWIWGYRGVGDSGREGNTA